MTQRELEDQALELSEVGRALGVSHHQICTDICGLLGAENHAEADAWIYEAEERQGRY